MNRLHPKSGKLEMILGCMFSGKSSELINRVRQHKILGRNVLVVNHISDNRYAEDSVSSHDHTTLDALCLNALTCIWEMQEYQLLDVIFINEAQFFEDLHRFVSRSVDEDKKHVILCGLDGDYNRMPFSQITELIPFADVVEKRSALCIQCRDGTIASFSKRIINSDQRQLIGHTDTYIPVCRFHYLEQ